MMRRFICVAATSVTLLSAHAQVKKPNTDTAATDLTKTVELKGKRINNDSILLSWNIPAGLPQQGQVPHYVIYRCDIPEMDITNSNNILAVVNKGVNVFVDKNIEPGVTYYYAVTIIDQLHHETRLTNTLSVFADSPGKKLVELNASAADNEQVNMRWKTTELAPAYFEIEKSFNGKDFNLIAKMSGGNASSNQFETTDVAGNVSTLYYRVKAVDKNGSSWYSNIQPVTLSLSTKLVTVFPNILLRGEVLTVKSISENNSRIEYLLLNNMGKTLCKGSLFMVNGSRTIYETRSLPTGRYVLQIIQGNQHQVIQIIVQ